MAHCCSPCPNLSHLQDRRQLLSYGAFGVLGFGAYRWLSSEKPSDSDAQQISQQQSSAPGALAPLSLGCHDTSLNGRANANGPATRAAVPRDQPVPSEGSITQNLMVSLHSARRLSQSPQTKVGDLPRGRRSVRVPDERGTPEVLACPRPCCATRLISFEPFCCNGNHLTEMQSPEGCCKLHGAESNKTSRAPGATRTTTGRHV